VSRHWLQTESFSIAPASPLGCGCRSNGDADNHCKPAPKRPPATWIIGNSNRRRTQEGDDRASHHAEDSGTGSVHAGQHGDQAQMDKVLGVAGPVIATGRQHVGVADLRRNRYGCIGQKEDRDQ